MDCRILDLQQCFSYFLHPLRPNTVHVRDCFKSSYCVLYFLHLRLFHTNFQASALHCYKLRELGVDSVRRVTENMVNRRRKAYYCRGREGGGGMEGGLAYGWHFMEVIWLVFHFQSSVILPCGSQRDINCRVSLLMHDTVFHKMFTKTVPFLVWVSVEMTPSGGGNTRWNYFKV